MPVEAPDQNGKASATIDVLSAEVRVLMVGSRQVTLSVYRQLDPWPANEVEPFGRVRDGKDPDRAIHVVGKNPAGDLVRSSQKMWVPLPLTYVGDLVVIGRDLMGRRDPTGLYAVDGAAARLDLDPESEENKDDSATGWGFSSGRTCRS